MNGATLRAIRTACGYTIDQFARLVQVSGRTLSRWELDTHDVPSDVAVLAERKAEDFKAILRDAIPAVIARDEDVVMYRHDSEEEPPAGYDRVLWNAAVAAWVVRDEQVTFWAGDAPDEDEEDAA